MVDFKKHTSRLQEADKQYKMELLKLHVAAEEVLVMAEKYKRPISELSNLHDIIRKIIHVRD